MANKQVGISLKVEEMSRILNTDKMIISSIGDICFRRCILSYDKEYLNPLE